MKLIYYTSALFVAVNASKAKYDAEGYDAEFYGGFEMSSHPVYAAEVEHQAEADAVEEHWYGDGDDHGHFTGDGHGHAYEEGMPIAGEDFNGEEHYHGDGHDHGHYMGDGHEHGHFDEDGHGHEGEDMRGALDHLVDKFDDYPDEETVYGNVPNGAFYGAVHDFNEWDEIWSQEDYEGRIESEAELMVALEALRGNLVELDGDIDYLYDCIDENSDDIGDNEDDIQDNDGGIAWNDDTIDDQRRDVKRLQKKCRRCQEAIDTDRDFLILYCQQFAFAPSMIGACADVLTCIGTRLDYRADIFTGEYLHERTHKEKEYNQGERHDHDREHEYVHTASSSKPDLTPGHY